MSTPATMPYYRVNKVFSDSTDAAFQFVNLEKRHKKQNANYEERMKDIGGRISPTWAIMSFVGLLAAIGIGIFEAYNAQGAIAGIVDPMGSGVIRPEILMVIGASISIIGMIFGHLIYEGLSEGFHSDPHTGQKSPNSKIWLSVVGFIGAIVYVWYQYVLVSSAIKGAEISNENGLTYMPYVVIGVAVLELLIGAFILHRAFSYLLLFTTGLLLASTGRHLNSSAIATNDNYRQYMNFLDVYNRENPSQPLEREGNSNIRKAIAHYSGIDLPQDKSTATSYNQKVAEQTTVQLKPASMEEQLTNSRASNQKDATKVVEDFMNDTTDQDLTA
jgi:hypothetical protein